VSLISQGNYALAMNLLEEFLTEYPGNSYALKEYAIIIRQTKGPSEALELLKEATEEGIHVIREKSICYIYLEEYEKALNELNKLTRLNDTCSQIKSFCKIKLNQETAEDLSYYVGQQVYYYEEEKALEHIITGHRKNRKRNYFSSDWNVEEVYHNIREHLSQAKPMITMDWMTSYLFRINSIGYSPTDIPVNHLKVTTLPNSTDIITMFPYSNNKKNIVNDYEEMLTEDTQEQFVKSLKRKSQVEKFQERYGKKN